MRRMFRAFAERTGSDLRALAACIRGSRQMQARTPPDQRSMRRIRLLASSIRMTKATTTRVSVATF